VVRSDEIIESLKIIDSNGRIISMDNSKCRLTQIDISSQSDGLYLLVVKQAGQKQPNVIKLIKE
jgi:hypothetical protein